MGTPAASTPTPAASGWSGSDYGSAIGAGVQIGGSIASGIIALLSSMRESSASKMARGKWEGLMTPVNEIMGSLYNNPAAEGVRIPYSWNAPGNTQKIPKTLMNKYITDAQIKAATGPGGWSDNKNIYNPGYYKFAPNAEMQSMYSNFLNRNYGISNSVANSMVAGSMKPLNVSNLGGTTPSVAGAANMYKPNAQALTTAVMGAQTPGALRQQDYLNNAANLSAFNLQRAKTLGDLIG